MVMVSISETYDLHTKVNKMTLIAVHTPRKALIQKMYPGLCMNYKYFRIHKVDVVLSTAQQLPLGVDQIGLDSTQIRPQDMMNPILYKAVSNDSWSTLEARLQGLMQSSFNEVNGSMADVDNDDVTSISDEHGVYYSLLANRDGFRVAHPQQGLTMRGLRPLVFEELATHAVGMVNGSSGTEYAPAIREKNANGAIEIYNDYVSKVRGHPRPMPRLNTTYITGTYPPSPADGGSWALGTNYQLNGMGAGTPVNTQIEMPNIPPVMLGAIILPPVTATTGILYYRMVTRCWIEFTDVRPITDVTSFSDLNDFSASVYHSDYAQQSKSMDTTTDMVDIKNGEIEKIMEGK